MTTSAAVRTWVRERLRPISLTTAGPPVALPVSLSRARVVAVASPVRSAHELIRATHTILRSLVVENCFRAVMIEGVDDVAAALDRHIRTGDGDPVSLLASGQPFVRFDEVLDIVSWMARWNRDHPKDQLSIVHDRVSRTSGAGSLPEVERMLARRDLDWHAATGQRVVHCGGTAHLVVGDPRLVPPDQSHTNAGGLLRRDLGTGFGVLALTVGAGKAPFPVPLPAPDLVEHVFNGVESDAALLDLATAADGPPPVRDWAQRPISTRMIGPTYDPARDHDSRIDTGPLAEAMNVIVHVPRFRAATPFEVPVPDGST